MKKLVLLLSLVVQCEAADRTISGLWMMGQSLCDGSESLPVVSTKDTGFGNLMF